MNHSPRPAKLLLCLVGRHRGKRLVAEAKRAGARGGTVALGKSVGNSRLLRALSLADIQQDVVFIVMGGEAGDVVAAVKTAAKGDPGRLGGEAVLLDVPWLFLRRAENTGKKSNRFAAAADKRSEPMESGYKLITIIVNSGFGEDAMAVARKAGASGGTILNAQGTGTEADVKFLGITLAPEKDMLLIIAEQGRVQSILEALSAIPELAEPGGGIFFSQNVEEFFLLGGQRPWAEAAAKAKRQSARLRKGNASK